jgi:hypothetical protein
MKQYNNLTQFFMYLLEIKTVMLYVVGSKDIPPNLVFADSTRQSPL